VGGLTLAVSARRPTPYLRAPAFLRPFLAERGGDIRLDYTEDPVPPFAGAPLLFDSGSVWKVYRRPPGLLYTFESPAADPPLYKAVAIDSRLARGTLYFPPPAPPTRRPLFAAAYPLDDLLFQHRLARDGAAEVHACGVVLGGRVALFCGESGAGKSTLARLFSRHLPGAPILSDDRIVLRRRGGRVWAWGTPWHGDAAFARPGAWPLGAVFFLEQAGETSVRRLGAAAAAARLFARTFPPPWDGAAVGRVLGLCSFVGECRPAFTLRFRRDHSVVAAVLGVSR